MAKQHSIKPLSSGLLKTHHCGEINARHIGLKVTLCGWLNKYRDLGGVHFIDLWDREGLVQLAFDEYQGTKQELRHLSLESVLLVTGQVRPRPPEAVNKKMPTGQVEVAVQELRVLSPAASVPFLPRGMVEANEDLRLKYRYLDLRTERLQNTLRLRSRMMREVRETLYQQGFMEVETPILYKSTPEGARDYLVPSRVHPGKVYALPQSPQTLKQLLMIGGSDKYFQLCRCFRDEDLRADRQPEFTQIDIEASFATQEYVRNLATLLVQRVFSLPESPALPMITYHEAMERYGTDKPDTRFDLLHYNATALFHGARLEIFAHVASRAGLIKAIFVPRSLGELSRKELDGLLEVVKPLGGKGVAWFKLQEGTPTGGIAKFISSAILEGLQELVGQGQQSLPEGLFLFCASADHQVAHACADAVRRHLAKLGLMASGYHCLWVRDFPLLEYSSEDQRFYARHHPFTGPLGEDRELFFQGGRAELEQVRADAYDLVINGYEVAGGSLRIYENSVQGRMFEVLGFSPEAAQEQFGFFLEALQYGTPPHGGIAFGFDRIVMLAAQTEHIQDVIAFPKTTSARDLMSASPSAPQSRQLDELKLRFD